MRIIGIRYASESNRYALEHPFKVPLQEIDSKAEFVTQKIMSVLIGLMSATVFFAAVFAAEIAIVLFLNLDTLHTRFTIQGFALVWFTTPFIGAIVGYIHSIEGTSEERKVFWDNLPTWPWQSTHS